MSEQLTVSIDPSIEDKLCLGWMALDRVDPARPQAGIESEMEALGNRLRDEYATPADAAPRHRAARTLYRSFGVDPTRYRPSSEALLRRVLTGKPLYRINAVVDGANFCSLEAGLPVGLYDLDQVCGPITACQGRTGEGYEGIGKGRINLEGRLILRDREGPFGNPSADSHRTRVRDETRRILFVFFAPGDVTAGEMERLIDSAMGRMVSFTGGVSEGRGTAPVRD